MLSLTRVGSMVSTELFTVSLSLSAAECGPRPSRAADCGADGRVPVHLRSGRADRTSCAIVLTQATDCRIRGARMPAGTALADPAPGPARSLSRRGPAARREIGRAHV